MTRTLILMRHAQAAAGSMRGDRQRPLTERGLRDAAAMAGRFDPPDVVVHSTTVRTSQTAHRLRTVWRSAGCEPTVAPEDDLYAAQPERIVRIAGTYVAERDRVWLVGHNPGLPAAWAMLTGDARSMPTASLAVLASDDDPAGGLAAMRWRTTSFARPGDDA